MDRILIVEDTDSLREVLGAILANEGYEVVSYSCAEEALKYIASNRPELVLADFKLPQMNGISFLKELRIRFPNVPFLLMTAFGSIEIAVEAMREGANDFLTKPIDPNVLLSTVREVISQRKLLDRGNGTRARKERLFITENPKTKVVLEHARKVARVDTSVLLLGESGTGKELLARYIHEQSPRCDKPFVAINCAAMPADLLESEFFGHDVGAFTGATQTRVGVLEYASEGTIFLDELGEMPLQLQVKLLRALQEREIKRLGSNKTIKINPRVISATNRDITKAIEEGLLREDLYYRVAVVSLSIPALRDRREDLELLVDHYIDFYSKAYDKYGLELDEEAQKIVRRYSWPGNARELENVIERAVILSDGIIRAEHLGLNLAIDFDSLRDATETLPKIAEMAARAAEINLIKKVLVETQGNKMKASRMLGVSYKTLLNKVKEYHLGQADEDESLVGVN